MVDPEESFFDQGGHSLRATRLIAALNEGGAHGRLSVAALFEHSTIRAFAAHIDGASTAGPPTVTILPLTAVDEEVAALAAGMPGGFDSALRAYWHGVSLASRRVDSSSNLSTLAADAAAAEAPSAAAGELLTGCAGENVLLTGATGFLGSFVLRELLAAGDRGPRTIFCLVRASATETALERVIGTLEKYGLWQSDGGWAARIEGIEGDTSVKDLGLSTDHYQCVRPLARELPLPQTARP
jgi:hypothetical protein